MGHRHGRTRDRGGIPCRGFHTQRGLSSEYRRVVVRRSSGRAVVMTCRFAPRRRLASEGRCVLPICTVACVLHTWLVFDELSVGVGTLPRSARKLGMLGLRKGSATVFGGWIGRDVHAEDICTTVCSILLSLLATCIRIETTRELPIYSFTPRLYVLLTSYYLVCLQKNKLFVFLGLLQVV